MTFFKYFMNEMWSSEVVLIFESVQELGYIFKS